MERIVEYTHLTLLFMLLSLFLRLSHGALIMTGCLHCAAVCWRPPAPYWGLGVGDDGACQGV